MRGVARLMAASIAMVATTMTLAAQKLSPDAVAARMSGTWTLNRAFTDASRGRSGGGTARPQGARFQQRGAQPTYPQGIRANPTNTEPTSAALADMTPEERAERGALREMQQVPPALTITASAELVTIEDERGAQTCEADGRSDKLRTFGVYMDVKCKWDKNRLRQEFSTPRATRIVRTYSLDAQGHLVVATKIESIATTFPETVVFYNRS
jgi:hypothetical protein